MDLSLFDVIRAVQDEAAHDLEAIAVLDHLLNPPAPPQPKPPPRFVDALIAIAVSLSLFVAAGASHADPESESEPPPVTEDTPVSAQAEATGYTFLPSRALFDPLLADVRWPRFSAEYQNYVSDPELNNVASANFGGMLPIVQGPLPGEGRWELGFQAGVFSIFDLDGDSFDLVNADYWFGVPVSVRWHWFSSILRVYHQSSHLGDEFLLRGGTDRINLSYEAIDLIPSFDLWDWGRVYAGGGYLFNRDPSDLKPKYLQAGVELKSPVAFAGWLRPIGALDLKRTEEQHWATDYSARLGVQFENAKIFKGRRLLLLAEYYDGHSPNGQFFDRRIEFWGVGVHFFF